MKLGRAWFLLVHIVVTWVASSVAAEQALSDFDRNATLRMMRKVNSWQQAHPMTSEDDRDWARATWYTGVMAAYKASGDQGFLQQARRWGKQHHWQVGAELHGANKLFCVETWLELYFIDRDKAMLEPTVRWLATPAPNTPAGSNVRWYAIPKKYGHRNLVYVDSLYGAPALAMLAKATGDAKYLDIMHRFFWDVSDELYDKDDHLFYWTKLFIDTGPGKRIIGTRDVLRSKKDPALSSWMWTRTERGKKVFWSRGNGWAYGALVRILDYLPENDPQRPRYVKMFQAMSAALAKRQGADGLWRTNLDDPAEFPMKESSGSACFCYGMAWGIRHGQLDRMTYLPVVKRAWSGIRSCVSPEGKVQWGQKESGWPEAVAQEDTSEYLTGMFLLAASEAWRLAPR